jgi:hypothetical protein
MLDTVCDHQAALPAPFEWMLLDLESVGAQIVAHSGT